MFSSIDKMPHWLYFSVVQLQHTDESEMQCSVELQFFLMQSQHLIIK